MPLVRLVSFAVPMLAATLVASFTPLWTPLSAKKIQIISTYATGLLVGAALTVIIPEGVEAVYDNRGKGPDDGEEGEMAGWIGGALLAGFILMYLIDTLHPHATAPRQPLSRSTTNRHRASLYRTPSSLAELEPLSVSHGSLSLPSDPNSAPGSPRSSFEWDLEHDPSTPSSPALTLGGGSGGSKRPPSASTSSSLSTVVGLLAHSLADGISLGAASTVASSAGESLDLIVFIAIMLHKAPTAFALSSLLIADPACSPGFIRRSLIAFSFAAPVGALVTYALLGLAGMGGAGGGGMGWYTGMVLVFSGGTFLFVATHVMERKEGEDAEPGGMSERGKVGLVLAGMVTPGLLGKLVGHGH